MVVLVLFFPLALLSFKVFLAMLARVKGMDISKQHWVSLRLKITLILVPFLILPLTVMILLAVTFFDTLLVLEWEISFIAVLVILSLLYLVLRKVLKKAFLHFFMPELLKLYDSKAIAETKFNAVYPLVLEAYAFPIFIFLLAYQI